jgi:hypothetical protein
MVGRLMEQIVSKGFMNELNISQKSICKYALFKLAYYDRI